MSTFAREVVPRSPALDVDAMLDDRGIRVLVCCGSGGVGKTTTAAALALRAAERGRSVVVLTIDPARRLAQSLGLTELDNDPRPVLGVDGSGSLDAMMLDMKRTFDEFVESNSDPERAATIIANPFYQSLSSSFAGTQEYMAMEKLGQLRARSEAEDRWDLIIVDTPPSRSALDFLDAPRRLGSFLDGRFLRILAAPAKAGGRAVHEGHHRRLRRVHQCALAGHRRPGPHRHPDLRRVGRHAVRRLPAAGGRDVPHAPGAGHRVPRGGGARARCAAGGVVLRGAARDRQHAARRPRAQPGADHHGARARRGDRHGRRRAAGAPSPGRRSRRPSCGSTRTAWRPSIASGGCRSGSPRCTAPSRSRPCPCCRPTWSTSRACASSGQALADRI